MKRFHVVVFLAVVVFFFSTCVHQKPVVRTRSLCRIGPITSCALVHGGKSVECKELAPSTTSDEQGICQVTAECLSSEAWQKMVGKYFPPGKSGLHFVESKGVEYDVVCSTGDVQPTIQ